MDNKWNTGEYNAGSWNTGDWNTGDWNAGFCNTGDNNTGDYNAGNYNTGDWNAGYCNTGNWNTGNYNIGNYNTGKCNIGDWNIGDWNTGYCNSMTRNKIFIFNRECTFAKWNNCIKPNWMYFSLPLDIPEWCAFEDMTDDDKIKYPDSEKLGGYLLGGIRKKISKKAKVQLFQQSAIKSWNNTAQEDRELTYKLPNFDAAVFYKIFGIDVREKRNA